MENHADGGNIGSSAETLSVVFANKNNGSLLIVEDGEWSTTTHPLSTYEPIGIVVIPGEHGVLKDSNGNNQCGVMSIKGMNCTTPKEGGYIESMYWGVYGTNITELTNYNKIAVTNSVSNTSGALSSSNYAYLPIQKEIGGIPERNNSPYAPSPYVGSDYKSGGYNESYGTTAFDTSTNRNVLSDFDGRGNTDKILNQRGYRDYNLWKPNPVTETDYPAASCCDMFATVGTKQGDWYLPSAGELGYIAPRSADINDILDRLIESYGIGVRIEVGEILSSSSECDSGNVYELYNQTNGQLRAYTKNILRNVRAFMRI